MSVRLGLTTDGRWDLDTATLAAATAEAGFRAIGIGAGRVDQATRATLADAGLACHELMALMVSDDAEETLAAAQSLADAAALVGAEWILAVFRAGLSERTRPILQRCTELFTAAGAGLAVEFSPLGAVPTLRDGLAVVEAAATGGTAGVVIDTWHFCFGESTWEDLASMPLEQIAYVQFTDALAPLSDNLWQETMQRRALPGEGTLELRRFADTLLGRGWDGTVSVEVLNRELRELPVPQFARLAHDATALFWA